MARCDTIFLNDEVRPMDDLVKGELESIISELGALGQRVLGFARLVLDPSEYPPNFEFNSAEMNFPSVRCTASVHYANFIMQDKLTFLGFISIYDPPRDNVDEAVRVCQGAGIKVVMVTGDHPSTAKV